MFDARVGYGLWAALLAVGTQYGLERWDQVRSKPAAAEAHAASSLRKLPPLTVPIIARGQVQGYVVAKIAIEVDEVVAKALDIPPESYVVDETFRLIYSEAGVDFAKLARADLERIRNEVRDRSAKRLKPGIVKDVLFEDFNFVPRT